jgi:hypothetical protein
MDEQVKKSLTDLIDETLAELEELKKSRMSAAEVKIEGPGEGIAGKPSDGELDAKKAEDKKDEDEEDEEKEEAKEEAEEAKKAEDCAKAEDKKDDKKEDKKEPHKDDPKHEEKEKAMAEKLLDMHKGEMKKSLTDTEALLKSYVDERFSAFEGKLSTIIDLVNKISDQPVAPKGVTANVTPLLKSTEESSGERLSKSEVASKLIDLKKSGQSVDSMDVVKAEMGQDLESIVKKYKIS